MSYLNNKKIEKNEKHYIFQKKILVKLNHFTTQ